MLLSPTIIYAATDGFDCPAGKPNGTDYKRGEKEGGFDGWGFLEWNGTISHPGEDWNRGAGETDFGDPLFSISSGRVISAMNYGKGWGNIVLIEHELPNGEKIWSQYAHLSEINVTEGKNVNRGDLIGKIGNANGEWASHLHFEIRKTLLPANYWPSGLSKETIQQKYYSPTDFINSHRPIKPSTLTASSSDGGKINLSWTKSEDPGFSKYEIYRSLVKDGTLEESKRTLVYSSSDIGTLSFTDSKDISPGSYYYRIFNYSKSGLVASSDEVSVAIAREYINITNHPEAQQYPTIDGDIITWQDNRLKGNLEPNKLRYYDLGKKIIEEINIQIEGLKSNAQSPFIKKKYIIYVAQDYTYNSTHNNVYAVNIETGSPFLVCRAPRDQMTPVVSDDGIAVWSDLRSGNLDLYYLDLKTAIGDQVLVQAPGNQRNPRIWGNKVVWKDSRANNSYDLYLKEMGGGEILLTTSAGDGAPDIWENWVVWEYKGKVSLMNTETKAIKVLADKKGGQTVRVRDNRVVYSVAESGSYYIHIYNISTGEDVKLDLAIQNMPFVAISGNTVVFDKLEPNSASNLDIYMTKI